MIALLAPLAGAGVGDRIELSPDEVQHLRVRRGRDGEMVALADGRGRRAWGTVRVEGRRTLVAIEDLRDEPRPLPLALLVGAGERERFAWLAEKATELGVTTLIPLETDRTAGVATRVRGDGVERIARRALEAVKQCGAAWATEVELPVTIAALPPVAAGEVCWLADAGGAPPPAVLGAEPVRIAVGPEGGFTEAERAALLAAGYRPIGFGANILRFETAALLAAAAVQSARLRGHHG